MTPDQFRTELERLGLTQVGAARVMGYDPRTVRRWASGSLEVPRVVELLLPLMTPEAAAALLAR